MGDFEYRLRIKTSAYGGQKALDAWCARHDTSLMRDLWEPEILFTSIEDLTMFKLEFGGEHVDTLREG